MKTLLIILLLLLLLGGGGFHVGGPVLGGIGIGLVLFGIGLHFLDRLIGSKG